MRKEEIRRPDETTLKQILSDLRGTVAEVTLRLIWQAGLSADEVQALVWSAVDLSVAELRLSDRTVPLPDDLAACLHARYAWQAGFQRVPDFVALSDIRRTHMHRVSLHRAARKALDDGGLPDVRLTDLRDDFIIRQLQTHDWTYVVRVSGLAISTLYANYAPWFTNRPALEEKPAPEVDEDALFRLILAEGPTPAGMALLMTWQLGMTLREAAALTWDQVNLTAGAISLPDRTIPLFLPLTDWLRELRDGRPEGADPHVLLTPRAEKPFDDLRLSVVVRQTLIRGGMESLTPRLLTRLAGQEEGDALLLRAASARGSIDRAAAMELLAAEKWPVYNRLRRLVEEGRLVRIGARYYPTGTVVPPSEHYAAIRAYFLTYGGGYRKEVAELLGVELRSAEWILQSMQKQGLLTKEGQRWMLPPEET